MDPKRRIESRDGLPLLQPAPDPSQISPNDVNRSSISRQRPLSRAASTTSAYIATSKSPLPPASDAEFTYQQNSAERHFHPSAEDILVHSGRRFTNPGSSFPLDPDLKETQGQNQDQDSESVIHGAHDLQEHPTTSSVADADLSNFSMGENSLLTEISAHEATATPEPGIEVKGSTGKPVKKSSATSLQNDLELKKLFRQNEGKSLQDIATQLQGNERGPQSEKTRQIFAMLWLDSSCKKSTGSVPRGRVYGHYVSRCGTERVTVLNPASFGKLVRVMFPAIQTRRLGMRGESKYHYCGLSLNDDLPTAASSSKPDESEGLMSAYPPTFSGPNGLCVSPQLPADMAVMPSPDVAMEDSTRRKPTKPRHSRVSSSLFWDPSSADFDFNNPMDGPGMIERELYFPITAEDAFRENEPIDLPNINLYLPTGTDQDTAAALTALYRSNCTSLIDCVRFCREKPFFHLFTSFHGTLTVPVQKLLINPAMAPWIKECDWLMYQKMIRVVAPLTLQVVPKQVVDFLKAISKKLGSQIRTSFASHPAHVIEAKLGPATIFANLLDRTLRVNLAAHAAANILCNNANRDQMYDEWIMNVEPVKIVQNELPNCGYSEVLHIMHNEIRGLLEPLGISWGANPEAQSTTNVSTEGVLDRWTNFLTSLPERFPKADARMIMSCVNGVATAALRDITMNGGKSFGSWWITKLWLDEMLAWLAEKGGFMNHTAPTQPFSDLSSVSMSGFSYGTHVLDNDGFNLVPRSRGSNSSSHHTDGIRSQASPHHTFGAEHSMHNHSMTDAPTNDFDLPLPPLDSLEDHHAQSLTTMTNCQSHSLQDISTSASLHNNNNNNNNSVSLHPITSKIRAPPTLTVSHAALAAQAAATSTFSRHNVSERFISHSHDDSGVGMGLGDDDDDDAMHNLSGLGLKGFTGFGSDSDVIIDAGMGIGSGSQGEGGDVVVC